MTLRLKSAVILAATASCSATLSAELPRVPRSASMTDKASEHEVRRQMRSDDVVPQKKPAPSPYRCARGAANGFSVGAVVGGAAGFAIFTGLGGFGSAGSPQGFIVLAAGSLALVPVGGLAGAPLGCIAAVLSAQ
jgi:hypothetical protein